jgi:hypothetical protein
MFAKIIPSPYREQLMNAVSLVEIDAVHTAAKREYPDLFYTDEEELKISKQGYTRLPDRARLGDVHKSYGISSGFKYPSAVWR